jgi:serine/threonine-protein kinase
MRPKDPFIGRDILGGQFQVLEKIGTGGMGSVYKASQPAMNRTVAIKILHPKLAGRKDLTSRFRREARAMSQLTHPNTVKVFMYGVLEEDGSLYIAMEMLEGKNLNQTVRKEGPLPSDRAIPVLIQVCGALQEAHDLGIVHRDLKPENIFLCRQGGLVDYPKVLDFGLAKVTERQMQPGSVILTQEGMVFGTAAAEGGHAGSTERTRDAPASLRPEEVATDDRDGSGSAAGLKRNLHLSLSDGPSRPFAR